MNFSFKSKKMCLNYCGSPNLLFTVQVQNGKTHAAGSQSAFKINTFPSADFSPFLYLDVGYFGTRTLARVDKYNDLVLPFRDNVWLGIVCVIVAFCIVLFLTKRAMENDSDDLFSLFIMSFGLMINESACTRRMSLSTYYSRQILLVTWVLPATFFGMAYQSNLLAFLIKVPLEEPVNSYQDIIDRDMTMYLFRGVPHSIWTESPVPVVKTAFQKSYLDKKNSTVLKTISTEDAIASVVAGTGVFPLRLNEAKSQEQYISYPHCLGFRIAYEAEIVTMMSGYHWSMNHPLRDKGNRIFLAMRESGLFMHSFKKVLRKNSDCEYKIKRQAAIQRSKKVAVTLEECLPIFMLTSIGMGMSVGAFLPEVLQSFIKNRKEV